MMILTGYGKLEEHQQQIQGLLAIIPVEHHLVCVINS